MNHKMVHYCAQGTLSISINGHGAQQTNQTKTHTSPHLLAERITIKKKGKKILFFPLTKWFLLLKCFFSSHLFSFCLFFYLHLSQSPSLRTPIWMQQRIQTAIFCKIVNLFSALTMCANQSKLLQLHRACMLINSTLSSINC